MGIERHQSAPDVDGRPSAAARIYPTRSGAGFDRRDEGDVVSCGLRIVAELATHNSQPTTMLTLKNSDYQKIVAHGREGKPLEICGLLVGTRQGDDAIVAEVHRVDSTDPQETTYSMDGLQYMKIDQDARERGLEIVGIYHTHPATQPYPSKTDVARAHWDEAGDDLIFPGYSYLIVRCATRKIPNRARLKSTGAPFPKTRRGTRQRPKRLSNWT